VFAQSSSRFTSSSTIVETAAAALQSVLNSAGASRQLDAVDIRIVNSVRSYGLNGKLIDSQHEGHELPRSHLRRKRR
jgi:hypothetical protein